MRLRLMLIALLFPAVALLAQETDRHEIVTTDSLRAGAQEEQNQEDTPERVPVAIVERVQLIGKTTTRLSFFDNRVIIVTMREGGKQFFFRKWTMGEAEYSVYLKALMSCVGQAGLSRHENIDEEDSHAKIYLNIPGRKSRSFSFSPLQVQDLATTRLNAILDDIQKWVASMPPSAEELQHWKPEEGDRVELFNGTLATVEEVQEGGVIILQYDETSILEVVPHDAWSKIIFRLLP